MALAAAIRVDASGSQTPLTVFTFNTAQQTYVSAPFGLGAVTDSVYLTLYGTGIRGRTALTNVSVQIGGTSVPVTFAGDQTQYPGLDQVNIGPLPRSLSGRGELDLLMTVDGKRANAVKIAIQ